MTQPTLRSIRLLAIPMVTAVASALAQVAELPAERQSGAVSYLTGGVSLEQSEAFKQARGDYALSIEVLRQSGGRTEFTADADVRISNSAGTVVLDAKAEGPYVLVKLPPGDYSVQAASNGQTIGPRKVSVPAKGHVEALLVFPESTR